MSKSGGPALVPFLCLLFTGTVCSSMVVPYMGYFIVNELGREPWTISVYAGGVALLATITNRLFAKRIDLGESAFVLIGIALGGFMAGSVVLALYPSFWVVLTVGIAGFGISTSAVSTMYSLGAGLADKRALDRSRMNAYMRATTSTAWMVGPAFSFLVADRFGGTAVFYLCTSVSIVWAGLWWWATPENEHAVKHNVAQATESSAAKYGMWLAVTFVFCLSSAHSLTFTALPLFYVQEVGLPGYAPGTAFSMKTFIEVFAIFSTPFLIAKFGLRVSLLATTLLAVVTLQYIATVQTYPQMLLGAAMEGLYYGLYASLGISFVQSFSQGRTAAATALYWNTLIVSGVLAGPVVGLVAQLYNFQAVIQLASAVAVLAAIVLSLGAYVSSKEAVQ